MNRSRIEGLFDQRSSAARAVVLVGVLVGDLLLVHRPSGGRDWGLAAAGIALCAAAGRWAFGALVALSGLLVVAHTLGSDIVPALKVLAAVTLFELSVREYGRRPVAGAAVLALAVAVNRLADLPGELPSVLYKTGIVAGLPLLMGGYVRVTRDAARAARAHAEQEEARAGQRLLAARAAERTTIARELHDLVAHHVSSMVLRVGVARHVVPDTVDARVIEVLDDLHSSGSEALADLRRLVAVLRDPDSVAAAGTASALVTPGALPAALESVLEGSRRAGLAVTAAVDPVLARLDAVRGLAVLRLVQEGLANAAKHAGPGARAELTVRVADDAAVHLTLQDDGAGRPGVSAPGPSGHGLIGMRERVDLFGGRLDAGPTPRGWRLTAELPALRVPSALPAPPAPPAPLASVRVREQTP
ncbi:histidine kinase [Streptomyces sp. TLI_053]|uniref:sensor histidine kinase n=1 Tax=Streptomyces sp. TLI_053 TaxID=1855352 RepID=UPI001E500AEB|nr:histidine kinase [Streptomyces sp. TLI_053]